MTTLAAPPPRRLSSAEPPAAAPLRMTEAQYLAFERSPERAQEAQAELFANGEVREMSGVKRAHSFLVQDLVQEVRGFLDETRFELHSESVKFRPPRCRYFYPDVQVTPSPPAVLDAHDDVLLNPVFITEVLSRSTEATDRGEKQVCYLNTPSVLEYWLVAQDAVRVERHHRTRPDGAWDFAEYDGPAAKVPLPVLGGAVSLAKLYRRVDLDAEHAG